MENDNRLRQEIVERPYRWTQEGAERVWSCYARRSIIASSPTGYYPKDFYQQILKIAKPWLRGTKTALDIGCSAGTLLQILADRGWDIAGIDLQTEVISSLRDLFNNRQQNVVLKQITSNQIPFESSGFDVVFCTEVLEHMLDPDRKELMSEIKRVLKPDGILIATTPYKERLTTVICPECLTSFHPMGHVQSVDESIAQTWLSEAHFIPLTIKTLPTIYLKDSDDLFSRFVKKVMRTIGKSLVMRHLACTICFVAKPMSLNGNQ